MNPANSSTRSTPALSHPAPSPDAVPLCATKVLLNRSRHFADGYYFEIETDPANGDWDLIGPFDTREAAERKRIRMIGGVS